MSLNPNIEASNDRRALGGLDNRELFGYPSPRGMDADIPLVLDDAVVM